MPVDPFSATIGAGEGLLNITERLGLLEKLKRKLMKDPDLASAKLETVLIEMTKVYRTLGSAVDEYLGLWLIPSEANIKWRAEVAKLRHLAAGQHEADMRKAKGDCGKIWSLYIAYLQPWFSRVLDGDEAQELFVLFRELSEVDSHMVDAIEATSTWLTDQAERTLAMVVAEDFESADRQVQEAWAAWQPASRLILDALRLLGDLRASFISATGAV